MIELLVGMIASGKSTYCRRRAEQGALIINDDAIVMAVHGGVYSAYNEIHKSLYKGIENYIIHHAHSIGYLKNVDVVIDRPCFKKETRARYIALAQGLDDPQIVATCFKTEAPEIHARRRFESDNRGMSYEQWLKIVKEHMSQYEKVDMAEGYHQIRDYNFERNCLENVRSKW